MARSGFPSMTALLGLLAVVGYQNRDQLSQKLGNRGGTTRGGLGGARGGLLGGRQHSSQRMGGLGGLLGSLGGDAGGPGRGGLLGGGLGELSTQMRQNGHGETIDSWVSTGTNRTVAPHQIERAVGPDVLDDLMEHTGLLRDELLARLSRELPNAVDQYTPHGRLPGQHDFT